MKGIIFTELLKMLELHFGAETVECLVVEASLPSGGAYTSVGTYYHEELVSLLECLSARTGHSVDQLMHTYGKHMFSVLHTQMPTDEAAARTDTFTLLMQIETEIHVEVRRLYPDADLPRFEHTLVDQDTLFLNYQSERGMASFAEGLISGCIEYFGESITLERSDLGECTGHEAVFVLRRLP